MVVLFAMRMPKRSRLAGGRAPKGRRGAHTHAAIMAVLFAMRNDTWVGNPSGPAGHLPCKAEEFCLRTDKLFAAMDSNLSQHISGEA